MAKRLTDTRKWDKRWFRELKPKYKCFWQYICDRCDNAGIWEVDIKTAEHYIKVKLDLSDVKDIFNRHILVLSSERWFVIDFIEFQYNCSIEELNPNNKAHLSVIRLIEKYDIKGALKGLIEAPLRGALDKDKDKDMDQDKDKDKNKDNKKQYLKYVFLIEEEHQKLVEKLGEEKTEEMIGALNDYIGSKGKQYKSHYHTILNWVRMEKNKGRSKLL